MNPLASLLQVLKNKNVQGALGGAGVSGTAAKGLRTLLGRKPQQAQPSNAAPVPVAREIMNLTAQRPPVPMGPVAGPNPAYGFNMQGGYQNPQQPFPRGRYTQPQQFSPSVMQAGWDMPMNDLEILRRPLQGGYADQGNINLMGY